MEAESIIARLEACCGRICCRPHTLFEMPVCSRRIYLLPDQTQQHMLRADLFIPETLGLCGLVR